MCSESLVDLPGFYILDAEHQGSSATFEVMRGLRETMSETQQASCENEGNSSFEETHSARPYTSPGPGVLASFLLL